MLQFTHRDGEYLQVDGADIYFESVGNPEGEALVLLHGGLGNMIDFNGILNNLPEHFRFIGIDFRGQGKSTLGTERLSYQRYQADVEAVLDHLGIDTFSLLGFSDGGITAYKIAAQTPSRVKALVSIGASWRHMPDDPVLGILGSMTPEKWSARFPDSVAYYNAVNPSPDFDRLVNAVVGLWTDMGPTGYPNSEVGKITASLLIVRGDQDHLFPLEEAVELHRRMDGSDFFNIPFAGHEVHKEMPGLFLAGISAFL